MSKKYFVIIAVLLALLPLAAAFRVSAQELENGLKITEIKLGGGTEPKEFVELFNDSSTAIDLSGLQLEYAKTSFSPSLCNSESWKAAASASSSVTAKPLSGLLEPFNFAVITMSLTDNAAGSLQLTTIAGLPFARYDLVGWGETSPCYEVAPAATPPSGQAIKRTFAGDGRLTSSSDQGNAADFSINTTPLPGDDECLLIDCYEQPPPPPVELYREAYITELLPDPASPKLDSEDEFIELYNPYDENLDLTNYKLHTASESSTYQKLLQDIVLAPGEYRAFYAKDTKLSLVNGKTGHAWLTAPDDTILFETEWYPSSIESDQAWALAENGWQLTDTPTPGAANQISTNYIEDAINTASKPCPIGKFRNPETGRCKNLSTAAAGLKPCKPTQERSAETNRCRNIVRAGTTLTPCKPNQVRNPETGRCRKIEISATKSCASGYERNSETNRCRKVASGAVKSSGTDGGQPNNPVNYIILGVSSGLLLTYAGYEYRQDIVNAFSRFRLRFAGKEKEMLQ